MVTITIWPWTHLIKVYKYSVKQLQADPPETPNTRLFNITIGCHLAHSTDFLCALVCYLLFFPLSDKTTEWRLDWMLPVLFYNLAIEAIFFGGWHCIMYGPLSKYFWGKKYNQQNQYEEGNLRREITFTTLGFIQSSAYQMVMMHLMATGKVSYYNDFWSYPVWSIFWLLFVTYWREFHFYWVHRMIHPWRVNLPLIGDPGFFLYKNFHKLHHLSYNPGPFSGLSMHPVEHLIYYTCTLFPLFITCHPLHFLYSKFHADIAPIGGHDGFDRPGGAADYHYLHHAKYECNYGVPLVDFDRLFGTWMDYKEYKENGKKKK